MDTGKPESPNVQKGKRVAIVVSEVDYSSHFLWIAAGLKAKKVDVCFVWLTDKEPQMHNILMQMNVPSAFIHVKKKIGFIKAFFQLFSLIRKLNPEFVHAHLFNAGRIAIPIARLLGIKSIYTRHYSTLHHDFFPRAVIQDKWINRLSDVVVAVSNGVANVLEFKEGLKREKIKIIPHGFDFTEIKPISSQEKIVARKALGLNDTSSPVIGVVSRFVEWKGVQYILPAFKEFIKNHKDAVLVLANATGDYKNELEHILKDIPVKNIKLIDFMSNQQLLFGSFDCFIHVPTDADIEAYGQVYIEALAYQLPCIFTISGIAGDFAVNNHNCVIVPYKSAHEISIALKKIFDDTGFASKIAMNGRERVISAYGVDSMVNKTAELYGT